MGEESWKIKGRVVGWIIRTKTGKVGERDSEPGSTREENY